VAKYTKEDIKNILENDFLLNPKAFMSGRTNDDVVDSMLMCAAIEEEWTELFAKWVDNHTVVINDIEYINHTIEKPGISALPGSKYKPLKATEIPRIQNHYERVKKWIDNRGWYDAGWRDEISIQDIIDKLMLYAINY